VWVSLALPAHLVENDGGDPRIVEPLEQMMETLGRKRLDLLWLPYAAFPKPVFSLVKVQLEKLLKQGVIGAYGVQADIGTDKVAKGLFENRKPAPVAWLANHDGLRPLQAEAVAVARKLGIAVVAQPRPSAPSHSVASAYLEVVAGKESAGQQAAHHRWVLQRGFGLAAEVAVGEEAVLQRLHGMTLSEASLQLLDAIQLFSRPHNGAPERAADDATNSLEQRMRRWQQKVAGLSIASSGNLGVPASSSPSGFIAGVDKSTLENLQEQASTFKANNKVIYKEDFFDKATFAAIVNETKRLWKSNDIEGNCNLDGTDRLGGYVLDHASQDSSLYNLIYGNEGFRHWVSTVVNEGTMWPSDFPIELREYGEKSQGMGCHPDLQMYAVAKKDMEFAITVDNLSKCITSFYDGKNKKHEVNTKANSVMMVGVNAATHCVSPTYGGHRTILKFIYVGDYRKSKSFSIYKGNECGAGNENNKALRKRRESGSGSLEL